jgi:putative membrane protein
VLFDPDARFLLANERTLLAWVRTALTLVAGGLILTQLADTSTMRLGVGVTAILSGAIMAVLGYVRFRAADRAIRAAQLPIRGRGPAIQVLMVIGFAIAIAAVEVIRAL